MLYSTVLKTVSNLQLIPFTSLGGNLSKHLSPCTVFFPALLWGADSMSSCSCHHLLVSQSSWPAGRHLAAALPVTLRLKFWSSSWEQMMARFRGLQWSGMNRRNVCPLRNFIINENFVMIPKMGRIFSILPHFMDPLSCILHTGMARKTKWK